ncbi:T9SS type A sorting domain-containing protein [Winogradskyella sp. PE311]|uniref:T9SS type A sorting domain-containing protein n=1 Tax=Winogradskyella sp. PE311 TaxID=3366943 RepID=UPI0039813CBF
MRQQSTFVFALILSLLFWSSSKTYATESDITEPIETNLTKSFFAGGFCNDALSIDVVSNCDPNIPNTFDFSVGEDIDANDQNPSCDGFGNFGYWLSFTSPASGSVQFSFGGEADNVGLEVLDACGGNTIGECLNNLFDAGDSSELYSGLTPGETYYAVVWRDTQEGSADICLREGPTCFEPTNVNFDSTSDEAVEISWNENGIATTWNIEWGIEGFNLGTGILIENIASNPYTIAGLLQNVGYDFYIRSNCAVDDLSDWVGPFTYFNSYCESIPTSNDGEGVSNVTIGNLSFESFGDVTYEDHTAVTTSLFRDVQSTVAITFATGFTYDTNIWIDLNDNLVFDESELVFQGESGNQNPDILEASFLLPFDASLGNHRMRIGTADAGQATPNPCYSGNWGVTLDFTVNVMDLNCVSPDASFIAIEDCDNNQFYIDVNITSLGDATSLEISNDFDASTLQSTTLGIYQIGPFPFGESVLVSVANEQDNNCTIQSSSMQIDACAPINDEPCNATLLSSTVDEFCNFFGSGTILGATDSGIPNDFCSGDTNDDVWFQFTATSESQIISIQNVTGGTFNLDHNVYAGTCDSLIELYCSDSISSTASQLTIGSTYYIRIYSSGSIAETSNFDLCLRDAPSNVICNNAVPFCSLNGAFTTANTIGIPGSGNIACLATTPNPTWNTIEIGSTGRIEIEIVQTDANANGLDVDFVLWGPFDSVDDACVDILIEDCPTCPNNTTNPNFYPFGNIMDCSYSSAFVENLTIEDAQYGEVYLLLVTNFSGNPGTISIEQTNLNEEGSGSLTAQLEVDLGPDLNICEAVQDVVALNGESAFADSYEWYFNGILFNSGEDEGVVNVTESGVYTLIAYNENCDVLAQDDITVSFLDCASIGIINVSAYFDDNDSMTLDPGENYFTNGFFTYEKNNDGVINTIHSSTGNFTIASDDELNTYDINYYFYEDYEDCFDVSLVSFENVNALFGENVEVEFPIVNQGTCEDIGLSLVNQQAPRPGFDHLNYLIIENFGLTTVTGTVNYELDDDLIINAISSGTNYTIAINASGFTTEFFDLEPGGSIIISISLLTPSTVGLGELVTNIATYATAENDIVIDNNIASITEEVIGAFDPNDKMEAHGPEIVYDDFITTDEYLYYTIRFQNVGTAEAINVRIEDMLDNQLDETTFQMLRSSHDYVVMRTVNSLEWTFNNINLPAEQDDAEGSNGFVHFKIKPKFGYSLGDVIPNTASIYFDFNAPIITNTFTTTFVQTLSVGSFDNIKFNMYPNPAKDNVTIILNNSLTEDLNLIIYDIQGKQIGVTKPIKTTSTVLDVSELSTGLYFVKLSDASNTIIEKLIID